MLLVPLVSSRKPPAMVGTVSALLVVTVIGVEFVRARIPPVGMFTTGLVVPPLLLKTRLLRVLVTAKAVLKVRVELPFNVTVLLVLI